MHDAPGAGRQLRIAEAAIIAGALVHDDRVIHMTALRTDEDDGSRPDARALIRCGLMRCSDAPIFDRTPHDPSVDAATLRDGVEGMLLGLAVGDALGNTHEGLTPAQRRARHGEVRDYLPNRHAGGHAVGLPSDDTQLAFWTLRRLVHDGGLLPERLAAEFCSHRIFGIGTTVRAFIRAHRDEGREWFHSGQESAGNGSLMRIAPVLLPHLREPSPALWSDAAVASMITHNEPSAIGACVAFIELLWEWLPLDPAPRPGATLRRFVQTLREVEGDVARHEPRAPHLRGRVTLAEHTLRTVSDALDRDLDTATACDGWYSGAFLLETVPSVLYILERHGHDPEEAVVRAANDTKDNDTVAAVVGAAVGARHGRSALPARWIENLAGRTTANDDGEVFRLIAASSAAFVR